MPGLLDGAIALVVRCLQKNLSIGLIEVGGDPKPMEKGDFYKMKFRVDAQPIVEAGGDLGRDEVTLRAARTSPLAALRHG